MEQEGLLAAHRHYSGQRTIIADPAASQLVVGFAIAAVVMEALSTSPVQHLYPKDLHLVWVPNHCPAGPVEKALEVQRA